MLELQKPTPKIIEFGIIEKSITQLPSRISAFNHTEFGNKLSSHLYDLCIESGSKLISVDVFDTFLLRNEKSEARRYFEISEILSSVLRPRRSTYDILITRYEALDLHYRATRRIEDTTEADIVEVIETQIRALGVDPSYTQEMLDKEVEYEAVNLTMNLPLLEVLQRLHDEGIQTLLLSDMYLGGAVIADIISHLGDVSHVIDSVCSSADIKINKRSGKVFPFICEQLNIPAEQCLHIGDNIVSDYRMPREAGWNAIYLPISDPELAEREQNLKTITTMLLQDGIDISKWAKV